MRHLRRRVATPRLGSMSAKHLALSSLATNSLAAKYGAVVFDKDGTLLDFAKTWDPAIEGAIKGAAPSDDTKQRAIADVLGFDLEQRTCMLNAPAVHLSNSQLEQMLNPITDGTGRKILDACAALVVEHVTPVQAANQVLTQLRDAGIPTAVATNDDEKSAREQMDRLGWLSPSSDGGPPLIQHVFGCDSGFGHKPEPGMLLAAAEALGVPPSRCVMIGDAAGDLKAGKSAGFAASLLVGPPDAVEQHAGLADVWMRDLGEFIVDERPQA